MRISFKVSLTVSIMAVVGSLSLIFYLHIHSVSARASRQAAGSLFNAAFETIEGQTFDLINNCFESVHLATQLDEAPIDPEHITSSAPLRIIFQLLKQNPALYSVYFGYDDSRFLQIISAQKDPQITGVHGAPPDTWWILRSIIVKPDGQRIQNWAFMDEAFQVLSKRSETDPGYDPRKRPWYRMAKETDQAALSGVYTFNSLGQPGITASKRNANGKGIAGVDLTLQKLQHLVSDISISENSRVMIVDQSNRDHRGIRQPGKYRGSGSGDLKPAPFSGPADHRPRHRRPPVNIRPEGLLHQDKPCHRHPGVQSENCCHCPHG
jgi:adenylate cyclase